MYMICMYTYIIYIFTDIYIYILYIYIYIYIIYTHVHYLLQCVIFHPFLSDIPKVEAKLQRRGQHAKTWIHGDNLKIVYRLG